MKTPASVTHLIVLGLIVPLSAQNLIPLGPAPEGASKAENVDPAFVPGAHADQIPAVKKAEGQADRHNPFFVAQDASTLDGHLPSRRKVDAVVDLDVLREPSAFRKQAAGQQTGAAAVEGELALISAVYRESGKPEAATACPQVSLAVEQHIKLDPANVIEVVAKEISANPACACEIVKAAIQATDADVDGVVAIVEVAISTAPETMRIVAQCAIATVPEAVNAVQALLAKLDPAAGESDGSAKSAKDSKDAKAAVVPEDAVAAQGNPLDFPGKGPVGPFFGNPTGQPIVPIPPPVIIVPPVTEVNP